MVSFNAEQFNIYALMKKLDFYFFCFYNSLYKDGLYLESYLKARGLAQSMPEDRAIFFLCISTWFWTIILRVFIIDLYGQNISFFFSIYKELLLVLGIYAAYYYYFINNKRFTDLYFEYKLTDKVEQRKVVKKVYWYLRLSLVLLPLILWWTSEYMHIDLRH